MTDRLLTLKDVIAITKMGKTHIYERIKANDFPKPYPLGPRMVRWRESEIQNWIANLPRQE